MHVTKGQISTDLLIITILFALLFLSMFGIYLNAQSILSERKTILIAKSISEQLASSINNADIVGNGYEEKLFLENTETPFTISFQNHRVEVLWQTPSGNSSHSSAVSTNSVTLTKNITSNSVVTVKNTDGVIYVS